MKIKQYLFGAKMNSVIEDIERIYKPTDNGATFTFPEDFVAFKGHFPQQQLLPAVVQVELAIFVLSKALKKEVKLKTVKKAKFVSPIFPKETVNLTYVNKETFYDISIKKDEKVISAFQISVE